MIERHLVRWSVELAPRILIPVVTLGLAACGGRPEKLARNLSELDAYDVCPTCPTDGWSSAPMSPNAIEDHLTAMCCLRHLAEYVPSDGSQYFFGVCDFGAYDWDCARYGGIQDDGEPGCPGVGHYAQRWISFFGFDAPPTSAGYAGAAMGTCGTIEVMGFRYK